MFSGYIKSNSQAGHYCNMLYLYVVTNDDFMPQTWEEKSKIYRKYSKQLMDLRNEFAIDLIVHTKKMNEKFIELDSSFSKEIVSKGISLL